MQVIDLFSGIGGFSLAAHRVGWKTVLFCEKEPFCHKVLNKNFPNIPIHDDIHTLNYETIKNAGWKPEQPTIVVGGFPCQPFSIAGARKGTDDDRHLWPEMLRVIRETKPQWVVGENVSGLLSIEQGVVFEEVCASLEGEGYEVQPIIIPAASVGAWHKRDRIWFLAYANMRYERPSFGAETGNAKFSSGNSHATHSASQHRSAYFDRKIRETEQGQLRGSNSSIGSSWWMAESELRGVPDGISTRLDKDRARRLKALGNAIVPQVAEMIFEMIKKLL